MEVFLQRLAVSPPPHPPMAGATQLPQVETPHLLTAGGSLCPELCLRLSQQLRLSRVPQAFLKSRDADRRLDQLRDRLQRGGQQVPAEQQTEVREWLQEQRGEVSTFRSHCQHRQQQMEALFNHLGR